MKVAFRAILNACILPLILGGCGGNKGNEKSPTDQYLYTQDQVHEKYGYFISSQNENSQLAGGRASRDIQLAIFEDHTFSFYHFGASPCAVTGSWSLEKTTKSDLGSYNLEANIIVMDGLGMIDITSESNLTLSILKHPRTDLSDLSGQSVPIKYATGQNLEMAKAPLLALPVCKAGGSAALSRD